VPAGDGDRPSKHDHETKDGCNCGLRWLGMRDTTDSMPSRFQTDCNDKSLEDATPSQENSIES